MDDAELVSRLQSGDHGAFEVLYQRHLYRHAFAHCGGRRALAEEVVQDVFLSLFEGKFSPRQHVGRYLLVTVRSRALNACQRRENRSRPLPAQTELPAAGVGPEEFAHRSEEAALLGEALFQLSPAQRETVLLLTAEGLSWKEVAALSGVSLQTAFSRYRAALERLRSSCRSLSHA